MANCPICKENIQYTFLSKPLGTTVKDSKGKRYVICASCQQKLGNDKEKILAEL